MGQLRQFCERATRINSFLVTQANFVGVYLILFLMFLITADVLGRYLFSFPILGTYDAGQNLMVFIVFFCLAYAKKMGSHVRVTSVVQLLSERNQKLVETWVHLVGIFFFVLIAYAGWGAAIESYNKNEGFVQLWYFDILFPIYPAKFGLVLGAVIMVSQMAFDLIENLASLAKAFLGAKNDTH